MTQEECLMLIRQGGHAAQIGFTSLYRQISSRMMGFFCRHGADPGTAEDLLQETFVRLGKTAGSYSGKGTAESWIWQVARNLMIDHLRRHNRHNEHEMSVDDEAWSRIQNETPAPFSRTDQKAALEDCIGRGIRSYEEKWPEGAYAITQHMEGASIEEIAAQIGRTSSATKEYLSQCRKKLRPFIDRCREFLER